MMNALRTEYVNPKAVMCQNNQMNSANVNTEEENEKKQRSLVEERKSIQNSLLLLKATLKRWKRIRLRFRQRTEKLYRKTGNL